MTAEFHCPAMTMFRDGKVDYEAQHKLLGRLVDAGVDGAIILGSASEFYAMTPEVRREVALDAIEQLKGKMKVYVGTGCLNVADTVAFSNEMAEAGATGLIIVGPYYIGAEPEGVFEYYDQVASQVKGDIMIYNYPERTSYDVTPDILNRLLDRHDNIVAIKDTVESATHTQKILNLVKSKHPEFKVFSGFDNNFLPTVLAGGNGAIGGMSNMAPYMVASWVKAVNAGDFETVGAIHKAVCELFQVYQQTNPFMPSMKYILQLQGLGNTEESMLPGVPATDEQKVVLAKLKDLVDEIQDKVKGE
ncbi:dihydrodipicolinate synthase family protein [uncultured Parolsenella sp.]|uniref:dihydrodipicolinate synthase family protein n=1 Tax=uncultured Parolsenella sp. TaxID=2083008 RepID=UPI0027DBBB23|nr:dihydrodipicolinate synthase family protein [uncultured Parolsenella sp.]